MPTPDVDHLLRASAPEVTNPSGLGPAMAATARAVTTGSAPRPRRMRVRAVLPVAVTGVALLAAGGAAVAAGTGIFDGRTPAGGTGTSSTSTTVDELDLVAEKSVPADLPLPDGVTLDDAKAQVLRVLTTNPGLQDRGRYLLDEGVVRKHRGLVPRNIGPGWRLESRVRSDDFTYVEQTGVSAAYVFYARCQWERSMIGGHVSSDAGLAALERLGDVGAYVADQHGVHRVDHEGIGTVPSDIQTVRADFGTNCLGGFGEAPEVPNDQP